MSSSTTTIPDKPTLPFAIFIGPQRAGTSWLYRYFKSRTDICSSDEIKELFFFDFNFDQGKKFYFSHFKPKPEHLLAVEVSATYFAHPDAPKRIYDYFGKDIKLVCPLRHPVIRSYSLYLHYKRYGLVEGTLQEACDAKPEILITSHYKDHLQNWIDVFGKDFIHFCFQEDLARNQNAYVSGICNYLNIPFDPVDEKIAGYHNVATQPPIQFLANIAQKTAQKLRRLRLYWAINLAKKIGLKALIFGPEESSSVSNQIPEAERAYLEAKLDGQIKALEDMLGYKIPEWTNV